MRYKGHTYLGYKQGVFQVSAPDFSGGQYLIFQGTLYLIFQVPTT